MRPPGGPGPGGRSGDRIEVRGLRALGVHGVLAEERTRPQPFSVDLDVWVDTAAAAASDDLADTVAYAALATRAVAVVEQRSFALLEALAAAVAAALLGADDAVRAVAGRVTKRRPPVGLDVATFGVRVVRRRDAGPDPAR